MRELEEWKELGHEYRYRDQLMITEFGLLVVAFGTLVNLLRGQPITLEYWVILLISVGTGTIITRHLMHLNADRINAGRQKTELALKNGFPEVHLGATSGRVSNPTLMVGFAGLLTVGAFVWFIAATLKLFRIAGM